MFKYRSFHSFDSPVNNGYYRYVKSGFNEYGDEVSHWTLPDYAKYSKPRVRNDKPEEKTIKWFAKYIKKFEQKGVKVVNMPPVCLESYCERVHNNSVDSAMLQIGYPYVVEPKFMAVDDSCWYNCGYHINKHGVDQNTQKIIAILKQLK